MGAVCSLVFCRYSVTTEVQADPISPYSEKMYSVSQSIVLYDRALTVLATPGKCSKELMRLLFPNKCWFSGRLMFNVFVALTFS